MQVTPPLQVGISCNTQQLPTAEAARPPKTCQSENVVGMSRSKSGGSRKAFNDCKAHMCLVGQRYSRMSTACCRQEGLSWRGPRSAAGCTGHGMGPHARGGVQAATCGAGMPAARMRSARLVFHQVRSRRCRCLRHRAYWLGNPHYQRCTAVCAPQSSARQPMRCGMRLYRPQILRPTWSLSSFANDLDGPSSGDSTHSSSCSQ